MYEPITLKDGRKGFYAQGDCIFVETGHGSHACDEYRRAMARLSIPVQTGETDATMRRELHGTVRDLEAEIAARDELLNQAAAAIDYLRNYPKWRHAGPENEGAPSNPTDRATALAKAEDALSKINAAETGANSPGGRHKQRLASTEKQRKEAFGELLQTRQHLLDATGALHIIWKSQEIPLNAAALSNMAGEALRKIPEDPYERGLGKKLSAKLTRMERALGRIRETAAQMREDNPGNEPLAAFVGLVLRGYLWALNDEPGKEETEEEIGGGT